ncbi:MAG: HEAT repeat domain-containing protein, partial [Planctomycetes bacterium]|nr:HEAT repeat domain-containing protein [Planctomycetota bacterium]
MITARRAVWIILVSVVLTESLASVADASPTSRGDFSEYAGSLVAALKSGDADRALDLLEEQGRQYDNAEFAKILVQHCLQNDSLLIHREAIEQLARMKEPASRQFVIEEAKESKRWEIRAQCVRIMARYGGDFVFERLLEGLRDKKWQVRSSAIRALSQFRRTEAIDALIPLLKKEAGRLQGDIAWTLKELTGESIEPVFEDWDGWWRNKRDGYTVPRAADVRKRLEGEG